MKLMKSYHLFLTQKWLRVLIYLVYPIVLLLGFGYLGNVVAASNLNAESNKHITIMLLCALWDFIIGVELFSDILILGGIAAKDSNKLEYIKTSIKGMPIFRKSLLADGIRRFLSIAVIAGTGNIFCCPSDSLTDAFVAVMIVFFYAELGLTITRHFPNLTVIMLTFSALMAVLPPTITLIQKTPAGVELFLSLLLAIAIFIISRWLILKKARDSYYDCRNEKSIQND